jgi:hypothetical protein
MNEEPFANPLDEFDNAVELFRESSVSNNAFLAKGHEVRPLVSHRAGVAGADVADCSRLLRNAHVAAVLESAARTAHAGRAPVLISPDKMAAAEGDLDKIGDLLKERFTAETQAESLRYLREMGEMMHASMPITRNLQLAYKSTFCFICVYQDGLYQLLNKPPGRARYPWFYEKRTPRDESRRRSAQNGRPRTPRMVRSATSPAQQH